MTRMPPDTLPIDTLARAFLTPRRPPPVALSWPQRQSRSLETPEGPVVLHDAGEGPPVLLVHGWEGQASDLDAAGQALLAAGHRVIALDLPAHGASAGEHSSIPAAARALLSVQRQLGPLVAVVAHSVGCAVTVEALAQGLQAGRVVLLAAPARYRDYATAFAAQAGLDAGRSAELMAALGRLGVDVAAVDLPARAATLSLPALFVHSADDRIVAIADAEAGHRAWRGSRLLRLQGLGHRRLLQDPAVLAAVRDFVQPGAAQPDAPPQAPAPVGQAAMGPPDSARPASASRSAATRTLALEGLRVAWREFGQDRGAPPLVLLQRFRGTMDHWDPDWLDRLAAQRRVILFDSAGIGRSEGQVPEGIAGMAGFAARLIRALGHTRVDVLGWSMGGMVAQQLCLDAPALVRRAIVAGSTPGPVPGAPRAPDKVWQVAGKPVNDDEDFLYLFFADSAASQAAGRAHLARLHTRDEPFSPPVAGPSVARQLAAIQAFAGGADAALPRLPGLQQPVLVGNGFADRMAAAYSSYAMAQAMPQGRLVLYPDAGHAFLFQHLEAFAAEVATFLDA